jgi:hypothetical protein
VGEPIRKRTLQINDLVVATARPANFTRWKYGIFPTILSKSGHDGSRRPNVTSYSDVEENRLVDALHADVEAIERPPLA